MFESKLSVTLLASMPLMATFAIYGIYWFQGALIYPSDFPPGSRKNVDTPSSFNLPYEEISINTPDRETLKGYLLVNPGINPKDAKTVLILCPNAGNIGHSLPIVNIFYSEMKCNVGYGLSTGVASETGLKTDAAAFLQYLATHPATKNSKIVIYGRSLGGAVAIYAASLPAGAQLIKGMILENTFLSISKLIPHVLPVLKPFAFLCNQRWESERLIASLASTIPILFLSGLKDDLVPPQHMRTLFNLSKAQIKVLKTYAKGNHNDTCLQPEYWQDVLDFIREHV